MITHLCINLKGENGSPQNTIHLVVNNREIRKSYGSPREQIIHFIEHLIAMPEEFIVNLTVEGTETGIKIINDGLNSPYAATSFLAAMISLTTNELEILKHLNSGLSQKQIADKKSVNPQTIGNACCAMHKKFHCNTNGQMVCSARRLHIVS
ncbi:MAG: helix-turn-helix transcriptional regulator [Bacteroidota bacterium]